MSKKRPRPAGGSRPRFVKPDAASSTARDAFKDSEVVIGLVGAVGTDLSVVTKLLEPRLKRAGYAVKLVHIANDVIDLIVPMDAIPVPDSDKGSPSFQRASFKMTRGTLARERSQENAILALGAAAKISQDRPRDGSGLPLIAKRTAYMVKSLKHPDEVLELRHIYPQSFYLIGVNSDRSHQLDHLVETEGMTSEEAEKLVERDRNENVPSGQHLVDTFHMSDFFVRLGDKPRELRDKIWRFLSLLFANPHCTPEFEEYAMFLAFAASLRSSALARQVGAVIARDNEVLSTGANDVPVYGGGLHWAGADFEAVQGRSKSSGIRDLGNTDQNTARKHELLENIVAAGAKSGLDASKLRQVLSGSPIMEITEYGREVHAEMEAILCCVRNAISTRGAEIYTTTFPCHNCVKHIVAAGIKRVVYVEPYPKSKAILLHGDVASLRDEEEGPRDEAVTIEPYVGVGPRRFFDLYSTRHGTGRMLDRKDKSGRALEWSPELCDLRHQMRPNSYLDLELNAANMFGRLTTKCMPNEQNGKESAR